MWEIENNKLPSCLAESLKFKPKSKSSRIIKILTNTYQSIEPNTNPNLLLQPASYYGEKYHMN